MPTRSQVEGTISRLNGLPGVISVEHEGNGEFEVQIDPYTSARDFEDRLPATVSVSARRFERDGRTAVTVRMPWSYEESEPITDGGYTGRTRLPGRTYNWNSVSLAVTADAIRQADEEMMLAIAGPPRTWDDDEEEDEPSRPTISASPEPTEPTEPPKSIWARLREDEAA